ncbi:hypothetical protein IQ266_23965, partial [filamentous cyanobacterium LEGE 11480]
MLRRYGRRLKLIKYSEVSELWADVAQIIVLWFGLMPTHGGRRERYKLCFAPHIHETPLHLPEFNHIKPLQTAMVTAHLPLRLEAYQAGQDIGFGDVTINQSGMTIVRPGLLGKQVKEHLAWSRFSAIELTRGRLNVYDQSSPKVWMWTDCAKIPNLYVLLTLLTKHIGIKIRKA